jgi:ABC-type transporter MlaC component
VAGDVVGRADEQPDDPLAEALFTLPPSLAGIRYTYQADQPSAGKHPDTQPPVMLADGRWDSAFTQSVQYDDDVTITIDLGKKQEFRKLLRDSFDMKTIGRFALGRYWRDASDSQKQEYLNLFQNMVVEVYAQRFNDYNGQDFTVGNSRLDGEKDTMVTSYIVSADGQKIQIDWRVRFKNGKYQIVDVIVEGVSMSVTQRSDFSSVIQRGGGSVDVLITHLREKNKS